MNPSIKSKEIKGFSQGFVTITIPCNVSYKYFNSLRDLDGGKNVDFNNPEVCMAAVAHTAVEYFQSKLTGAPRDNLAARAPIVVSEALGPKGLVITIATTKSQTVLRKCCVMFASWFIPNKLFGMYKELAKTRSITPIGAKDLKGFVWASNQIVAGAKSANFLITTTAKVDENKFVDMMKNKFRAESMSGGVKPSAVSDDNVGAYETTHTAIKISKGHSAEIIRHFLWEYKLKSHYDGVSLWINVSPTNWPTKLKFLKGKKTMYVTNKWSKLGAKLGYALMAMCTQSGTCIGSELAGIRDTVKTSDITSLLDQL